MAFDLCSANQQLWRLSQQAASFERIIQYLNNYQNEMNLYWIGAEMRYYNEVISGLVRVCEKLGNNIEDVRRDISKAIVDIVAEEAEKC